MAIIKKHPAEEQIALYSHQQEAMTALDKANEKENFSGIVVIPTGGGKTMTAAYWLMKNAINSHAKIIWIAHRNLLLEQAYYTLERCATPELMPDRENFSMKIVSGDYEAAAGIARKDEVLLVSRQSLQKSVNVLDPWLMDYSGTVYCVIDECHHSAAKTYQKIYGYLAGICKSLKVIGLTATPFRTYEKEIGILQRIFYDDILYKTDLRVLIHKNILAYPKLEQIHTKEKLGGNLSKEEISRINESDIMPENFVKEIAENTRRNHLIAQTYCRNRKKYGKCIVFAVDKVQAVALKGQFEEQGVKAETVISPNGRSTQLVLKDKDNVRKINEFKKGNLDVLINVMILTEGADFPKAHTVFLTRPTVSKILMTQMVGRALRGPDAGGTVDAYIVSFIDDWQCKIAWESPTQLDGFSDSELAMLQVNQSYATEKVEIEEDDIANITKKADVYLNGANRELSYETEEIDISDILADLTTEDKIRQLFSGLMQKYPLKSTEKANELKSLDEKIIVAVEYGEVNLYEAEMTSNGTMLYYTKETTNFMRTLTDYFYKSEEKQEEKTEKSEKKASRIEISKDERLQEIIQYCETAEEISTSYLQRHFRLGYARAARIMDQLEELGTIEPYAGAKPRKIHKDVLKAVLKQFER